MTRRFLDFQFWIMNVLLTAKRGEQQVWKAGKVLRLGCGALASRWIDHVRRNAQALS